MITEDRADCRPFRVLCSLTRVCCSMLGKHGCRFYWRAIVQILPPKAARESHKLAIKSKLFEVAVYLLFQAIGADRGVDSLVFAKCGWHRTLDLSSPAASRRQ